MLRAPTARVVYPVTVSSAIQPATALGNTAGFPPIGAGWGGPETTHQTGVQGHLLDPDLPPFPGSVPEVFGVSGDGGDPGPVPMPWLSCQ